MGLEIEKKFLIRELPADLDGYKHHKIEQGYLCREPVIRIRKSDDDYYMTYKGKGMVERVEYNLPITREAYEHLSKKTDGHIIRKTRYVIPFKVDRERFPDMTDEAFEKLLSKGDELNIELDIFDYPENLIMAEVEFPTSEAARGYDMPEWFKEEVTEDRKYHNVNMAYGDV